MNTMHEEAPFRDLKIDDIRNLIDEGYDIVDVREDWEWNKGHLPGARHAVLSNILANPKAQNFRDRLHRRFNAVVIWIDAHRWHAIVGGLVLLFVCSLFGGYWLAERLESRDRDRLARDTLEEMKRGTPAEPAAKYARIEDIPGLPKYTDAEPGQPRRAWTTTARRPQVSGTRRSSSKLAVMAQTVATGR